MNKNRYSSVNSEANNNPNLIIPRDKFVESLKDRISKGIELKNTKIDSAEMLEEKRSEQKKWNDFNIELLSRSFDNNVMSKNYSKVSGFGVMHVNPSFQQRIESFRGGMANKITNLESILERVDLIPESIAYEIENNNLAENKSNLDSVFIVHGHDEAAKSKVARFVEKLKLKAVILHEQPNQGQTIIEKFETNAATTPFLEAHMNTYTVGHLLHQRPARHSVLSRRACNHSSLSPKLFNIFFEVLRIKNRPF